MLLWYFPNLSKLPLPDKCGDCECENCVLHPFIILQTLFQSILLLGAYKRPNHSLIQDSYAPAKNLIKLAFDRQILAKESAFLDDEVSNYYILTLI